MKVKEIQEKEEINLKLQNKKKVQKLKEKGITLIALVVTIIILLILAGVTLNMALSGDGLFSRARNAADKYKKAQEDEQELVSDIAKEMYSEYVGAKVTGYKLDKKKYKVEKNKSGTDKDQLFETETNIGWRIWDYDGTTLRIISEKPTDNQLTLNGVSGYNNGVYLINEICRQCYGQYEEDGIIMKKGISVANLRRSDIEKVSTYDYTKYKHKENEWPDIDSEVEENLIHYGESRTYETYFESPIKWSEHDSKWNYEYNKEMNKGVGDPSENDLWEQEFDLISEEKKGNSNAETKFKESYYNHNYKNKENEFKNQKYYDMLYKQVEGDESKKNAYWLSRRYTILYGDYGWFGLCEMTFNNDSCRLGGWSILTTKGEHCDMSASLRPIISINLKDLGYSLKEVSDGYELIV